MIDDGGKARFGDVTAAVRRLIHEVHAFHAQKVLANLEGAVAAKKPHLRLLFRLTGLLASWPAANALMLAGVILFHPAFRKLEDGPLGFAFGLSGSNERSFARLRGVLRSPEHLSVNGSPVSVADRLAVLAPLRSLRVMSRLLAAAAHSSPLVHVQSVIACATFMGYRAHRLPPSVQVVCVANDHSPAYLGFLAAAKLQGLRTCYIQHAPVTEHFPPLSFDLSILYDRSSAQAYENIALARGVAMPPVVLLSPYDTPFRRPGPVPVPMRVGVCLSLWPDRPGLVQLVQALSHHANVAAIVLRPHPRCRSTHSDLMGIGKVVLQPPGTSAADYFGAVDLVLAPNSGVTVEALHFGRPTFFTPKVDKVEADYYGFAKGGVVPVFEVDALDRPERLHLFFEDAWLHRYAAFDETVHYSPEEARSLVASAFVRLLTPEARRAAS